MTTPIVLVGSRGPQMRFRPIVTDSWNVHRRHGDFTLLGMTDVCMEAVSEVKIIDYSGEERLTVSWWYVKW